MPLRVPKRISVADRGSALYAEGDPVPPKTESIRIKQLFSAKWAVLTTNEPIVSIAIGFNGLTRFQARFWPILYGLRVLDC